MLIAVLTALLRVGNLMTPCHLPPASHLYIRRAEHSRIGSAISEATSTCEDITSNLTFSQNSRPLKLRTTPITKAKQHGQSVVKASDSEQPGIGHLQRGYVHDQLTRRYSLLCPGVRGHNYGGHRWVVLLDEVQEATQGGPAHQGSQQAAQDGDGADATQPTDELGTTAPST